MGAVESPAAKSKYGYRAKAEEVTEGVNLSGRVAIVTGASSGLGTETARVLALRGATVILAVRSMSAGEETKQAIVRSVAAETASSSSGGGGGVGDEAAGENVADRLTVMELNLASLASVRKFADAFLASGQPLHLLINNAGIMMTPYGKTLDGYEQQLGVNHLAHFLLTNLLLPKLKDTAKASGVEGRIVVVSSCLHTEPYFTREGGPIRFEHLHDPQGYHPSRAYGQSKLANVLHARELARRLKEEGANVTVNALHPGVIKTNLTRHVVPSGTFKGAVFSAAYTAVLQWFFKTIPQGAATTCYVATHADVAGVSGGYFQDSRWAEDAASAASKDEALARRLWDVSEKLVAAK